MVSRRDFASVSIRFLGDAFSLFYFKECASFLYLLIDDTFELKPWRTFHIFHAKFHCLVLQAGGKAGKDSKAKAKAVSRSARAGLQVGRCLKIANRYSILQRSSLFVFAVYLTCVAFTVPSGSYSQTFEEPNDKSWPRRSYSRCLQRSYPRIFNC